MTADLTFITNEPKATLLERFKILIKDGKNIASKNSPAPNGK